MKKTHKKTQNEKSSMKINGWVEEIRDLGGIKFLELHTPEGNIQVTVDKKQVSNDLFNSLLFLDSLVNPAVMNVRSMIRQNNLIGFMMYNLQSHIQDKRQAKLAFNEHFYLTSPKFFSLLHPL